MPMIEKPAHGFRAAGFLLPALCAGLARGGLGA
ncbi:hypothetical protein SAMN05216588_10390 [Pseudomonas flavescens]|uniref:Uncharacterized protein n=1 Tax=Phytopseudomonas flavescens TaxID=29435 RepID=A0A1G8AAV1_9GAMM|nr:hypothetical protein SAMN05216588_10390 [Pseudomonas flavescens]